MRLQHSEEGNRKAFVSLMNYFLLVSRSSRVLLSQLSGFFPPDLSEQIAQTPTPDDVSRTSVDAISPVSLSESVSRLLATLP